MQFWSNIESKQASTGGLLYASCAACPSFSGVSGPESHQRHLQGDNPREIWYAKLTRAQSLTDYPDHIAVRVMGAAKSQKEAESDVRSWGFNHVRTSASHSMLRSMC